MTFGTPQTPTALEYWPVDGLRTYGANARTHSPKQLKALGASIQRFGFNVPVAADKAGNVLAGHGRIQAARQIGLKEVPVVVVDHLDGPARQAYILADNRIADLAGWDKEILAQEIAALGGLDMNLEGVGFTDGEVRKMMAGLAPTPPSETAAGDGGAPAAPIFEVVIRCGSAEDQGKALAAVKAQGYEAAAVTRERRSRKGSTNGSGGDGNAS